MTPDNLTGDKEADAETWVGLFLVISDLVKALKNLVLMLPGNANTKILDADVGLVVFLRNMYAYGVRVGGILDGIIEEINEHLLNTVSVPQHLALDLSLKQQMMCLCRSLYVFYYYAARGPLA